MDNINYQQKINRDDLIDQVKNNQQYPLIVLDNVVVFPRIILPLLLEKKTSVLAVEQAMHRDRLVVLVAKKPLKTEEKKQKNSKNSKKETKKTSEAEDMISKDSIYNIATICHISQMLRMPDHGVKIVIEGIEKIKIKELVQTKPFAVAKVELLPTVFQDNMAIRALMRSVLSQFKECISLGKIVPLDIMVAVFNISDPNQVVDLVVFNLDLKVSERQKLLETIDTKKRLETLSHFLAKEIEILKTGKKLRKETSKNLGKMQKEVFLREQLKNIEKELGIKGGHNEISDLKKKLKKAGMPKAVYKIAKKELIRMRKMPSFAPEVSYIRTYLEWLLDLPWNRKTDGPLNIIKAEKILNEDHYGLEKVKERILEYLAVQKMVGKIKGPILCFVGPPGTGKTSIGKSIARALNRKFYRMSLGGIHDEAEIRGHRRTYVGSLPGRVIQGIKTAGTKNPVFMLDEIDKVGRDFRGDPSSALLEALDPEQNFEFSDHYLEVPFDLSDVMFITTANVLDTIPPALRDRMEVIRFPGYTEAEKFQIAKKYLIPKILKEHGLNKKYFGLNGLALRMIIQDYTREAGVRNLERELAKIARKITRKIAQGKKKKYSVEKKDLKKYLGPPGYHLVLSEKKDEIGVSTGLAWTEAGGEILFVESTRMPGRGKLILTGSLGKVMQESATAAFSYAKSRIKELNIKDKFWDNEDIHVHVPSGAIPKDGPSAGVAMASCLISLLTKCPVRHDIAMTGEVNLRGQVLEIGGVKEKVLAAHRAGAKTVILPKENEKNMDDITKEVQNSLKFIFVENMDKVLKYVLIKGEECSVKNPMSS